MFNTLAQIFFQEFLDIFRGIIYYLASANYFQTTKEVSANTILKHNVNKILRSFTQSLIALQQSFRIMKNFYLFYKRKSYKYEWNIIWWKELVFNKSF